MEKIPALTPYQQALNSYNPNVYPAHKRITAEEWNALLLSGFAQGNRQEEYLDQIINGHLPEVIDTINAVIDVYDDYELRIAILETHSEESDQRIAAAEMRLTSLETNTPQQIMIAVGAHNTDANAHTLVLNPLRARVTATEQDIATLNDALNDTDQLLADTELVADEAKTLALSSFTSVAYNAASGVLTFTRNDATQSAVDLPLENIISSGFYDSANQELVLVMVNGEEIRIPATDLVDDYFGSTGTHIDISISPANIISAILKAGSITEDKLSTALLTKVNNTPTLLSQLENDENFVSQTYVDEGLAQKQDTLVSGNNIKTIAGESVLGTGNITLVAMELAAIVDDLTSTNPDSALSANQGRVLDEKIALKAATTYVNNEDGNTLTLAKAYSDLHSNREDNPHNTTPAQLGVYTEAQTDTLITSVVDGLTEYLNANSAAIDELTELIDNAVMSTDTITLNGGNA